MAPKRSRSAASERSVSRKRPRGDSAASCSLATDNISHEGNARGASRRGRGSRARGRPRNRRGGPSALTIPAPSSSALHSSESNDSGQVSLDIGSSCSDSTRDSEMSLLDDPNATEPIKPNEELTAVECTVTDKLMSVVTGALPALRGELAVFVRGVLGERRVTPLAAMLRTVANFTTNVLPNCKKTANQNVTRNGMLKEKSTIESATKPAEVTEPPVVSYLWKQSLSRYNQNSEDSLVSKYLDDGASTSLHNTLHSPTRSEDPTGTDHVNGDPTLEVAEKPSQHENQSLQIKSESHMDLDPTSSKDTLNCSSEGNASTSNCNSISRNSLQCPSTSQDPTRTSHLNGDPTLQENPESQMDLDPTDHINANLTDCNRTLTNHDQKSDIKEDPTQINDNPTEQENCDLKPVIKEELTPERNYGCSFISEDPTELDWTSALMDLTFDDDMESSLRKIDSITSRHLKALEDDDDDLENLFPAVSIPQNTNATKQWGKPRGAARGARGAGRGARGRRGPRDRPLHKEEELAALQNAMSKFKCRRRPLDRAGCKPLPTGLIGDLKGRPMSSSGLPTAEMMMMMKTNDILSVANRPPPPARVFQLPNDKEEETDEEEMGVAETYAEYTPAKLNIGCRHPDPVVETASLSSVESADVTYKLSLPEETIRDGLLSALQLEAVVYASQAHEHFLPDETRAGFLIGDGAGVGKGRTIAGIIFENYLKGRKRAVWVSVSNDLKYDAERDLRDIGAAQIPVYPLNKMNYSSISSAANGHVSEGVVFSTYSALIGFTAAAGAEHNTRLNQLLAWCGPGFDGCIVFDECHRAKNLCPVTATKPSKTGLAVLKLQQALPKARLVYASATGASEPRNMAYMVRLGIWGDGTPFPGFKDFLVAVERRGVGAMEIVAMDMKLRGMYIARQLSFHGVTFRIEEVPLTPTFRETYDDAVKLWVEAMRAFQAGLELVNPSHKFRKVMWGQFWGAHQRFFKYLCIAAKVSRTVRRSAEAVRAGRCAVVGLQSTGEARTLDQLEKDDGKLTEFICTAKGVFQSLVEKQFPDPDVINDDECPPASPAVKRQVKEMKNDLLKKIIVLGKRLPPNTLDQLVDELGGAENVAEMTGRKGRVVQTAAGRVRYESRSEADVPLETLNLTEKQRFMDGEKNIAIISEAASSGISLQSDRRVRNHRRRVHITLELPWSADRAIQQFGRTHRSNQVNAPEYIFLISDLAGERRFASTVAKRLESLGALTHGDRRATETRDLSQFNIENKYGRAALRRISRAVSGLEAPLVAPPRGYEGDFLRDAAAALEDVGMNLRTEQDSSVDIQRFLNRLLGVPVNLQNALFQHFSDTFAAILLQAKRCGRFDLGILDLGSAGESVRRVRCVRVLRRHATGSAPVELHTILSERGLEWEKADRKFSELSARGCDPGEGFYLSRARWNNNHNAILCVASDRSTDLAGRNKMYNIYRPNLGLQLRPESLAEVQRKYARASRAAAAAAWSAQYRHSLTVCSHAYWRGACSVAGCEVGLRVRTYHVLSGSVLSVWARLEAAMRRLQLATRMQVVRVRTDTGLKVVGTLLPKCCIAPLIEELKIDALSFTDQTF